MHDLNLTPFRVSEYQRERDVIDYLARLLADIGGDPDPRLDTIDGWLVRLRSRATSRIRALESENAALRAQVGKLQPLPQRDGWGEIDYD